MQTSNRKILIKLANLQKYFPVKKKHPFQRKQFYVKAVKNVSIDIYEGETFGLVGESGSGKSTLGRTMIQLYPPTGGVALYYGDSIENKMPQYVKKIYKSIPSMSFDYDADETEIKTLEAQLQTISSKEEKEALEEKIRLLKIEFENKYGNILRLAGGMLIHPDLKVASKLLLEKYYAGAKVAKLKRELSKLEYKIQELLETETHKSAQGLKVKEKSKAVIAKKEALEEKLVEAEKERQRAIERIEEEKKKINNHPRFDYYESKLDNGIDLSRLTYKEMRLFRRDLQIIFQDPYSSLDPRLTVGNIIGEALIAHRIFTKKDIAYENYIRKMMAKTGLDENYIHRFPHQFSGGQRQRIGIARSLALQPKFIVCDEAVSALDVSIQSQIINLLQDLKEENHLTYLFITHDLGVVRYISDRIGVMYLGNLVELAPTEEIFKNPKHPYTRQLLNAIPQLNLEGEEIKPLELFVETDEYEFTYHKTGEPDPDWFEVTPNHFVSCKLKN
jgi:peptide/nickel transport system ATP-binding protein